MKRKHLLIVFCTVLLVACGGKSVHNRQASAFKDACDVKKTGAKSFVLDENTSTMLSFLQYVHGDTLQRLSFLNSYSNSIYLYNAIDGTFLDSIRFDKEGADGVGTIQGYYYYNDDSIFIYPYAEGRVYLADSHGKVQEIYHLYDVDGVVSDTTRFLPVPYMETRLPMFYHSGKLLLSGGLLVDTSLERKDNTFVCISYDVCSKNSHYAVSYPEMYRKYNWGSDFFYRQPSMTMISDGELLFSFAADHNLWRYNPVTGQCDSLYAGSCNINEIVPLSLEKKEFPDEVPAELISEWYYSQPSYESVYADPYKGLYYRIARLPNSAHKPNTFNDKPVVVIVLDRNLNYVGEERLPEGVPYDTFNVYVSPEGLNIHIYNSKDEDHATFYTYNAEF